MFKKKNNDVSYWAGELKAERLKTKLVDKLVWYEKMAEINDKEKHYDQQVHYVELILSEIRKYRIEHEPYTEN